ncbi:hypothetical protein IAR50_003823 [Cryptococcus sp. DSM 104548]
MAVHGNLSHAMRDNYNEHGVDEYYRKVAASYRNPFFPGIKKVVWTFMNKWWEAEGREIFEGQAAEGKKHLKILDMAAGSGEATLCLLEWASSPSPSSSSASPSVSQTPPDPLAFLRSNPVPSSSSSRPAFVPPSRKPVVPPQRASANGSGVGRRVFGNAVPPKLPEGFQMDIVATDPYTSPAYTDRTSRPCHPLSFTDLAQGQLPSYPDSDTEAGSEIIWDMIICSFALHLVTDPSELFALLYELSGKARWMVIVAPHKKPEIKETWGWSRWDIASWSAAGNDKLYAGKKSRGDEEDEEETELEIVRDKVKLRVYRSNAF